MILTREHERHEARLRYERALDDPEDGYCEDQGARFPRRSRAVVCVVKVLAALWWIGLLLALACTFGKGW